MKRVAEPQTLAPDEPLARVAGWWLAFDPDTPAEVARRRFVERYGEEPTLHSFRRAAALFMLRGGADPVTVSRILGHGSLAVTLRYLRQEQSDLAEVHGRTGAVDRLL